MYIKLCPERRRHLENSLNPTVISHELIIAHSQNWSQQDTGQMEIKATPSWAIYNNSDTCARKHRLILLGEPFSRLTRHGKTQIVPYTILLSYYIYYEELQTTQHHGT